MFSVVNIGVVRLKVLNFVDLTDFQGVLSKFGGRSFE
jgi:hypothetical protein